MRIMLSETKRKPRKKKANQKPKAGALLCVIVVFILGCLFIITAIQNLVTLVNWDNGGVLEYQGNYKFFQKEYYRNTNYVFVLGNGDILSYPCEYMVLDPANLENSVDLSFRYAAHKNIIGTGTHTGISISTADGALVFVQEKNTKGDIRSSAIGYFFIGIPCIIVSMLPVFFYVIETTLFSKKVANIIKNGRIEIEQKIHALAPIAF